MFKPTLIREFCPRCEIETAVSLESGGKLKCLSCGLSGNVNMLTENGHENLITQILSQMKDKIAGKVVGHSLPRLDIDKEDLINMAQELTEGVFTELPTSDIPVVIRIAWEDWNSVGTKILRKASFLD